MVTLLTVNIGMLCLAGEAPLDRFERLLSSSLILNLDGLESLAEKEMVQLAARPEVRKRIHQRILDILVKRDEASQKKRKEGGDDFDPDYGLADAYFKVL